jgi:hypothetical protein|tara:strand:+ start:9495 stop:9830 length:336 start_codon:yes stop_codon:yes gene_type:complete
MKDLLRDALEGQILQDAISGDTTVLAEILLQLTDAYVYQCLGDDLQGEFNECYGSYAISTSDGHDVEWTYYDSEVDAHETFIYMQGYETDIHLYKYSVEFGYEVIESWSVE